MTNPLKTNNDLFIEAEVDFTKTLGNLIFLDKKVVPEYQSVVINAETGEVLAGALVDDTTGQLAEGSVPEGVTTEVRSRPIEGTCTAYDLIVEAEAFGNQLEMTVPPTFPVENLTYNQMVRLTGLTARHWSRTTRQLVNGRVNFLHTQGFKLRAEGLEPEKSQSRGKADK
jgi:hypothetical protein